MNPSSDATQAPPRWRWLPREDSWKYHALLLALGILVLGPLGGVTASYMNFSLGFFVGGQVLAGILGSTVTYGYGSQGKHGANYLQTAAASVAGMSGMGVLIQAMVWMGMTPPPMWQMVLYLLCIGMFGAGVGMLYTPILVDRLQLTFPSGLAVANILRALTDVTLLRASIKQLGGGMLVGIGAGIAAAKLPLLAAIELSASTFGAGLVVGARIGIPAVTAGLIGVTCVPYFVSIGWLQAGDPPRKITFLIALGMIMGAALVDLAVIAMQARQRHRDRKSGKRIVGEQTNAALNGSDGREPTSTQETSTQQAGASTASSTSLDHTVSTTAARSDDWKRVNTLRLWLWTVAWGLGIVAVGHIVLGQPIAFLALAVALVFVFAMINGISLGVSDSNPISSAFVVSVVLMAALGLKDATIGLMAGTVLLVSTSVACDMQQDRSTGWRLGTNRVVQFRYQVAGILMGALLAVGFAELFMAAYPVLKLDQTVMKAGAQPAEWSAAMTYKFVGVLRSLADDKPYQRTAIWLGIALGLLIEALRVTLFSRPRYQRFVASGRAAVAVDFALDAIVLPSPYAFSFGGFVNLHTSLWFGAGGVAASVYNTLTSRRRHGRAADPMPSDMSVTSLVGGGLIAGDALAALWLGVVALFVTMHGS